MGNRGKYELFDEWMDSMERLDAFVTDKPTNMEVEEEATDYMDVDPMVLMLGGRRSLLEATYHCGSHDRVEELGMGGSCPPHGGLCEEDQD